MFVEVAKTKEITVGNMKHVKAEEYEILIANVDGNYYAVSDRCGHMSASLSLGRLDGNIVTCPLHSSEFDVTTGKLISGPVLESLPEIECLPEEYKKLNRERRKLIEATNTYDLIIYELKVESDKILVKI
ncbi:MAG: Rieske (2Fe-2S) protein [Methanobacterium sp.]|jgi:nitrite reductase/ring-hydroxylating ferredoxin subunit